MDLTVLLDSLNSRSLPAMVLDSIDSFVDIKMDKAGSGGHANDADDGYFMLIGSNAFVENALGYVSVRITD